MNAIIMQGVQVSLNMENFPSPPYIQISKHFSVIPKPNSNGMMKAARNASGALPRPITTQTRRTSLYGYRGTRRSRSRRTTRSKPQSRAISASELTIPVKLTRLTRHFKLKQSNLNLGAIRGRMTRMS